jgi:hypothetical protein
MTNCNQIIALFKTPVFNIGFFPGLQFANLITNNSKNYYYTIKDFTGLKAYLKYRYWEANQITDQV